MEIEVMKDILGENDTVASENAAFFAAKKIFVLNIMGSPGSGKTTLLERTLELLADKLRIGVIEGDLFTAKDAARIEKHGAPVVQINTAGGCHLNAAMIRKALGKMDTDNLDVIIIENVGNLVCPAEFNLGETAKAVVLSVTEGEDKPMKYPLMFKEAAAAVINKTDLLPYVNFDRAAAEHDIAVLNPGINIFGASCTAVEKDDGIEAWCMWIEENYRKVSENFSARQE